VLFTAVIFAFNARSNPYLAGTLVNTDRSKMQCANTQNAMRAAKGKYIYYAEGGDEDVKEGHRNIFWH
jgi:hypothetical protein